MTEADPVLRLLWRDSTQPGPARRGPKQKVSVDDVVDAGIEVADEEGLDALSMRGLAHRLGLGAMSLYTYVPSRDQLIVLMVDQTFGRTDRPAHGPKARIRLANVAESAYGEYVAHPWLLETAGLRAWLGPRAVERYEWQLTGVDGLGLSDVEMDQTVTLLDGIAATAARARHAVVAAERRSGQTEAEWWEANAAALAEVSAGHEFARASRVGRAVGEFYQAATDPDRQFTFAVDCAVAGLLATRSPGPGAGAAARAWAYR